MIVYGDPQTIEPFNHLVERLITLAQRSYPSTSLDLARELLVRAGQLEQAVDDARPAFDAHTVDCIHTVTELLADVFIAVWTQSDTESAGLLMQALSTLRPLPTSSQAVTVKIPEGFAFYALYPEQYLSAAQRWLCDHLKDDQCIVIVGLRSIGTTLSALLKTVFQHESWQAIRLTVRPSGHPFERKVELPAVDFSRSSWCMIVDEGPGVSGSSFAAAAQAMIAAGIEQQRITFFPGHDGEPGSAANEQVRALWRTIPRYFVPLRDIRFNGLDLPQTLAAKTADLLHARVVSVRDFGGGLWREAVYSAADERPAICIPFERPKYHITVSNGEQILWKFAGFAAAPESEFSTATSTLHRLQKRFIAGDTAQPFVQQHGFVAQRWAEGKRLCLEDASEALSKHIVRYMIRSAGTALLSSEQEAGFKRLREMLYWNTWELLGEAAAEKTHRWQTIHAPLECYGDGRLDPHEWLQTAEGNLLKMDCAGHDLDHTMVGRQSVLWDIAGAIVEWTSENQTSAPLIYAAQRAFGEQFDDASLEFYQAAYAAFRGGMCAFCAPFSSESDQQRLWQAVERYKRVLTKLLED